MFGLYLTDEEKRALAIGAAANLLTGAAVLAALYLWAKYHGLLPKVGG